MKKLAAYLKPYISAVILAPLFMIGEVICDLLQPTFLSRIVDDGISRGDTGFIISNGLLMLGTALAGLVGGVGCTVFSSRAGQFFATDLREDMFRKVQGFSFKNLDRFSTASLITRLTNDVVQVQNVVITMLRMLVRAPVTCIGSIIMALVINTKLALITFSVIPVLIFFLYFIISKGYPLFYGVQDKLDRINSVMRENLTGMRVVKAFVRSEYEIKRFGKANDALTEITVKASKILGANMPIVMFMMNISVIIILWAGARRVHDGSMQTGQIIAFINYATQLLMSLTMSVMMLMSVSRGKASADRIIEVLNTEPDIRDGEDASTNSVNAGRLEFRHVSFRYEGAGGEDVLRDVSFTVNPGETVGILGATGAGKSTLVSLIPRFHDVTGGSVLIDGVDVRHMKLDALRGKISMVLQESILFSGTVRDNIRWGRKDAYDEEVEEAARAAQAHDFVSSFPDGYDTVIGQRGANLSGGQKQRLAIARALLKKPALLIMDDSTSAVDLATEANILSALKSAAKNISCIIIAQRISSVVEADKIIVMEDGRIAGMGSHRELMAENAIYREIYYSQTGEEEAG